MKLKIKAAHAVEFSELLQWGDGLGITECDAHRAPQSYWARVRPSRRPSSIIRTQTWKLNSRLTVILPAYSDRSICLWNEIQL